MWPAPGSGHSSNELRLTVNSWKNFQLGHRFADVGRQRRRIFKKTDVETLKTKMVKIELKFFSLASHFLSLLSFHVIPFQWSLILCFFYLLWSPFFLAIFLSIFIFSVSLNMFCFSIFSLSFLLLSSKLSLSFSIYFSHHLSLPLSLSDSATFYSVLIIIHLKLSFSSRHGVFLILFSNWYCFSNYLLCFSSFDFLPFFFFLCRLFTSFFSISFSLSL